MPGYNAELDDYKPSPQQNMSTLVSSSLEQDLKKQILGRSEAEKTFRPWWDTLEDYLLNALVLLGKHLIICVEYLYIFSYYSKGEYSLHTLS